MSDEAQRKGSSTVIFLLMVMAASCLVLLVVSWTGCVYLLTTAEPEVVESAPQHDEATVDAARLALSRDLLKLHWAQFETEEQERDFVQSLSSELAVEPAELQFEVQYLTARELNSLSEPTPLLKQAKFHFGRGKDEHWEVQPDGRIDYAYAFRSRKNCTVCHSMGQPPADERQLLFVGAVSAERTRN